LISDSPLLHGLTRNELNDVCRDAGLPRFRAAQIWRWLYQQYVDNWNAMRNISATDRESLSHALRLDSVSSEHVDGDTDGPRKILVELPDGDHVEQVLIPSRSGRTTVCVSSQVGCRFACTFCASGQAGFRRHLQAGEMVGQAVVAARLLGHRPSNVVFMGMGEPFDNYDAVLKAASIMNDADGLGIGARKITISTAGLIPGIQAFAKEKAQFELSVSLHAPTDALRSRLMPINRTYPLDDLIAACRAYTETTNRIITFEYAMIHDWNDTPSHAGDLIRLLSSFSNRVNLIPLSAIPEFEFLPSTPEAVDLFKRTLEDAGINTTLRRSAGSSIDAACGQLRFRPESVSPPS